MNPRLQKLFQSLEQQRNTLLDEIKPTTDEKLTLSLNNKWSMSQVVGHLVQAERMSVGYMVKKINAISELGNTGLWGEIKMLVFIASQRLPLNYKAPKTLGEKPPSYTDFASLALDWAEARKSLERFLETIPSDGLNKKIYRHPVMGRCSVVHCLKFFREHIIHHYPQIKRHLN